MGAGKWLLILKLAQYLNLVGPVFDICQFLCHVTLNLEELVRTRSRPSVPHRANFLHVTTVLLRLRLGLLKVNFCQLLERDFLQAGCSSCCHPAHSVKALKDAPTLLGYVYFDTHNHLNGYFQGNAYGKSDLWFSKRSMQVVEQGWQQTRSNYCGVTLAICRRHMLLY